jgi:lipopolysaccharide transport system ATP-binding protein
MSHAISVRDLTKTFTIDNRNGGFTALDRLSFDVEAGQVVGIIGRNGAGKSTLLKILARILAPTSGRAELHGRVGSLLEVGTGFHPDLSGRENIFLSAALLGMKEAEIVRRFDQIVDFSGVEAFIDTPVKRYSSGMYMRLAFSVAAHLEPEILLVDEVLSVGDIEFQKKCVQRLDSLGKHGQTVLFVSHNMQATARLCQRGLWVERGKLAQEGPIAEVAASYLKQGAVHPGLRKWPHDRFAPGDDVIRLLRVAVRGPDGEPAASINIGQEFDIEMDYAVAAEGFVLFPAVKIFNEWGTEVIWSTDSGTPQHGKLRQPGLYHSVVHFPPNLLTEGLMSVAITVTSLRPKRVHISESDAVHFQATEVVDGTTSRGEFSDYIGSVVRPRLEWTVTVSSDV